MRDDKTKIMLHPIIGIWVVLATMTWLPEYTWC